VSGSEAREIIEAALHAIKTAQDSLLKELLASQESMKDVIKNLLTACFESPEKSNMAILSTQLCEPLMGPHRHKIRRAQHEHLANLSRLSFDDYCQYAEGVEKLSLEFMEESGKIAQEQVAQIMPQFLEKLMEEQPETPDWESGQIGSDGWLNLK